MLPCYRSKLSSFAKSVSPFSLSRLFYSTFCIMAASSASTSDALKLSGPPGAHTLVMDSFALRQFNNPEYVDGNMIRCDPQEFEDKVNEYYRSGLYPMKDGYAPFCKHIFVPNFCDADCVYVEITDENKDFIQTSYNARKAEELPVLLRYISRDRLAAPVKATFLDIILYSREQITKENEAMGMTPPNTDAPWGIISVKGQLCNYETPMQPITMMRNALGREHGGSGVPLDREKYLESVEFWTKHVSITQSSGK